ncbi:hypothetical protein GE061_016431 [Apolygus lucorum]|uniref:UDP-glycosyltransferases domain-containing protein n=1 Tax=Apolygus lucorum TaxID=248454 RepID=A0A8S9XG82_APOLU|nr:hypothetical protein GE061_016431 [Apolygus lucorum]
MPIVHSDNLNRNPEKPKQTVGERFYSFQKTVLKSNTIMQVRFMLGTIALLFLTNHFVLGNVEAAVKAQGPGAGGLNPVDTKTPPAAKKVEPVQVNSKPTESVRPTGDSAQKSTKQTNEAPSNEKKNEAAQRTKTAETTAEPQREDPTPDVSNKQVPDVTAQVSNVRSIKPSRILVVLPMPFYSHTQNFMPIFKELAKRGHHLTVLSPFPQNMSLPNWEEIIVPNILKEIMALMPDPDFSKDQGFFHKISGFLTFGENTMRMAFQFKEVTDLFNDDSRQFDLVFVEAQFFQEPLLVFGHKFKAPVIALYPSFIPPEVAYYTGNPVMTSTYVPNMFFPFSNSMSFVERGINTAFNIFKIGLYNLRTVPVMDSVMREYLPKKDLPYVGDMLFNISFTFIDSHHILSYPYPRVNNIREFLGINTKPTSKLSQELQEFMDDGKDGVIFFTLGSHFQTSTLRPHILKALLEAFARLPNKILMKWDKDEPPAGLSPNVKTQKWFPQSAVLAHKNCLAFVTHTGVHGLVESLDHAVPVISVPLFADQHFFAKWVREKGVGLSIDIETVTPDIAYETIKEVISNRKFKENVIEISKLMKDLPQPTLDELCYWTEYVIRTKGAPFLRSGALNLAWYQRFGLDLLAVAVIIVVVPIWILMAVLKCLVSMCRRNKKPETGSSAEKPKSKKAKKAD